MKDAFLQAAGGEAQVRAQLSAATRALVEDLESKDLTVSWKNTKFLANADGVAQAAARAGEAGEAGAVSSAAAASALALLASRGAAPRGRGRGGGG